MKIAVPTRNSQVDSHFGQCAYYTLFTINEESVIEKVENLSAPQTCGCKSNIASVLKEKGVSVMLAGNMGDGALKVLNKENIQVYRGNVGDVYAVVQAYLKGTLQDSGVSCQSHQHEEGHACNHH